MSLENIKAQAIQIRIEKERGHNTAERVGKCLEDITDEFVNYATPSDIDTLMAETNQRLDSREAEIEQIKESISMGYFPDNVTFEDEEDKYVGNEDMPAVGHAQYHQFTSDGYVYQIIAKLKYSASNNARVIVRVQDDLSVIDPDVSFGTVLLDKMLAEDDYIKATDDIKITLEQNTLVQSGKYLVCYIFNAENKRVIKFREWFLWSALPEGYNTFIYKAAPSEAWEMSTHNDSMASCQVPLKIYSHNIAYDKYEALETRINSFSNSTPQLILPSRILAIVGKETNIYFDSIVLLPETGDKQPSVLVEVTCDKGVIKPRSWQYTPEASDIGNHPMTITIYNNDGTKIQEATTNIAVSAAANPSSQKRILLTGDDCIDDTNDVPITILENLQSFGGYVPLFIGSKKLSSNSLIQHEAMTGKNISFYANGSQAIKFTFDGAEGAIGNYPNWEMTLNDNSGKLRSMHISLNGDGTGYLVAEVLENGTQTIEAGWTGTLKTNVAPYRINITDTEIIENYSPFIFNDALDFGSYATSLGLDSSNKIDLYIIDMCINDFTGGFKTNVELKVKIEDLKKLVQAFHTYNTVGRVLISLPKPPASTIASANHTSYRLNVHRMHKLLIDTFDMQSQFPYVSVCNAGLCIDRYWGYPLSSVNTAARYTKTVEMHSDELHPNKQGYQQIADSFTAAIAAQLQS